MSEKYAVRNLRLCTKDCLCLYVCPTGATDTENSIIDVTKCIGCGACADACPSGAISMVPHDYPPQQKKNNSVIDALRILIKSKANAELIASSLSDVLAVAAVGARPPLGQRRKGRARRRLVFGTAFGGIVHVPADLALHLRVVGDAGVAFGVESVDDVRAAGNICHIEAS